MPWFTPTLRQVREAVRSDVTATLNGASFVGNSVLRVTSDCMAGLCHLTLRYIDWLSKQFLPDTAEQEWLDRHAQIWVGGRKSATIAYGGQVQLTGDPRVVVPAWIRLSSTSGYEFETLHDATIGEDGFVITDIRAITPGTGGNLEVGEPLRVDSNIPGLEFDARITLALNGGTETETDDELRVRVLKRIRNPPQGGAAHDYEQWALEVPGCTRAWCQPLEMGIGTVTVRVLFDDIRADDYGWPTADDLAAVTAHIDMKRPVAVKDFWVVAPIKQFIDVKIRALQPDTEEVRANIEAALFAMLYDKAKPGQTIFAAWKVQAVMNALGVVSFDLVDWNDDVMQSPGHMAVLGDIVYGYT